MRSAPLLVVSLAFASLLSAGCLDSASRTQRIPPSGSCVVEDLAKAGEPGAACVVAEECSAFCCACPAAGELEVQLCLGGACADKATACDDVASEGEACR